MRERKFRCNIQQFLNRPGNHANAAIVALVERTTKKDHPRTPHVYLSISDCSETIKLEFSTYRPSERENSLYKANVLVDVLTKFRDSLELELARFSEDEDGEDDW